LTGTKTFMALNSHWTARSPKPVTRAALYKVPSCSCAVQKLMAAS
jgi:hypothetical protein